MRFRMVVAFGIGIFVAFSRVAISQLPKKPRPFRVRYTVGTIIKINRDAKTLVIKARIRGRERERILWVTDESQLMKEGKRATLVDFKEGEEVVVHWRYVRKGRRYLVRYLADPVTFFAFFRYLTIKGRVKSFDPKTLTLVVEADGKEWKVTLPGRGYCCFIGKKMHRGREGALKGGEEIYLVLRSETKARAVFDADSWRLYGEREWKSYLKRREAALKRREKRKGKQEQAPKKGKKAK